MHHKHTLVLVVCYLQAMSYSSSRSVLYQRQNRLSFGTCDEFCTFYPPFNFFKKKSHSQKNKFTFYRVGCTVIFILLYAVFNSGQDAKIEPEEFTNRLQTELKSSPQPYLIPFLKVASFTVSSSTELCLFKNREPCIHASLLSDN